MWWQLGRVVIAMLMGQGVLGIMATPVRAVSAPVPDPSADGQAVYCLKSENARPLVAAAIAIGAARKAGKEGEDDRLRPLTGATGKDLTVAEWSRGNTGDFRRACAALVAERELPDPPPGPFWRQLSAVTAGTVPVVLGVVLTVVVTAVSTGRGDRRRAADDLHKAVGDHYRACRTCLLAWKGGGGRELEKEMDAPLNTLLAELRLCATRHKGWRRPRELGDALNELDGDIRTTRWPSSDQPGERAAKADEYLDRLDRTRTAAAEIVRALEHPLGKSRKMRKKAP